MVGSKTKWRYSTAGLIHVLACIVRQRSAQHLLLSRYVRLLLVTTGFCVQIAILVLLLGLRKLYEGYFEHN